MQLDSAAGHESLIGEKGLIQHGSLNSSPKQDSFFRYSPHTSTVIDLNNHRGKMQFRIF